MVADLLEFNSFAAKAIPVTLEKHNLNELMQEICYQWRLMKENEEINVTIPLTDQPIYINVDSVRFQQIVVNLLNNAKQAMIDNDSGKVKINFTDKEDGKVTIDIIDNGPGIPSEEQDFIFELFFQGEHKKYKVRGLGLGLSFSKMLAEAMGGELYLKDSSPSGTTFSIEVSYYSAAL